VSRLELPLLTKTLATGDILLRAEIQLRVQTRARTWEPLVFLMDSGTEMSTIPAARAGQ
jgi:hypothetical protein